MIRIGAVGDVHFGKDSEPGALDPFARLGDRADLLLLAGDLTQHGLRDEGKRLAEALFHVPVPVVSVLGNHDYHQNAEDAIRSDLEEAGVIVLEGESVILTVADRIVGIAGTKGFGGGFAGGCATEFGEPEMKSFVRHGREIARRLSSALKRIASADVRIGLTHYAPTETTIAGERLEIFPFLGSYLLGEAIDEAHCDVAFHGHAHFGVEHGATPGGVPVRNVAMPVIGSPYKVYCFSETRVPQESC